MQEIQGQALLLWSIERSLLRFAHAQFSCCLEL